MLVGRPFGGVAIVYNDRLKGIIYEVECRNDRLTAICIQYNDTESALIINVYMPCDTRRYDDSYGVYMDILDEVEIIVQRMQPTHVIFGGDFNTDLSRDSHYSTYLNQFIFDYNMTVCIDVDPMMVPYTFIGPTSNSRIDHILYAAIGGTVLSCDIVDNHLNSDHVPLKVVFDFNVGHVDLVERPHIRQTAWWEASSCDIQEYRTRLDNKVDNFVYDNCIENCTDVMCTKHDIEISSMYNNVIQLCLEAAEDIPKTGQLTSNKRIPGWSEHVEHLRREALVWHHHWRACGQPHEGDVAERRRVSRTEYHRLWKLGGRARQEALYDLMRKSRLLFKYALRKCKRNKNAIVADNIAENLCKKDDKAFWRGKKNVTNSKVKLPSKIGEAHGSTDISVIWKDHYSRIFSTVNESNCTAFRAGQQYF